MTDTVKRPRRMAREADVDALTAVPDAAARAGQSDPDCKVQTKASQVEQLLLQTTGASLEDLCQATGWQPHTCRAFLTGLRKKGKPVERSKGDDGVSMYRLTGNDANTEVQVSL